MLESANALKGDGSMYEDEVSELLPKVDTFHVPADQSKFHATNAYEVDVADTRSSFKERAKRTLAFKNGRRSIEGSQQESRYEKASVEISKSRQALINTDAFDSARIVAQKPPSIGENHGSSVKDNIKAVASTVAHPKEAIKTKVAKTAAEKLSRAQRPILSLEEDRHFLDLHEKISTQHCNGQETAIQQEQRLRDELDQIKDQRASLNAGWTLGHQVNRVRVVQNQYTRFPEKAAFEERDSENKLVRIRWEKYIGYIALYYTRGFTAQYIDDFDTPDYDLGTLTKTIERLVMASAPFQAWWISSRQLYRWEDPWRTARWFALFIYLWYTDHIISFFYVYILYIVIREGLFPSTMDSVRDSLDRTFNQSTKARAWGDLVETYGRDGWVEPLLDQVGPQLLLQLEDLADFCEVIQHFYKWTLPHKTAATLFFFSCCLLVTLLSDTRFCMKIVWFIVGFTFFLCWPLSSHYPKYRSLLDPFRWTLWDIPTNAERALEYLQMKADDPESLPMTVDNESSRHTSIATLLRYLKNRLPSDHGKHRATVADGHTKFETPPASRDTSPTRSMSSHCYTFRANEKSSFGELFIDNQGLQFSQRPSVAAWHILYKDLIEMRKGPKRTQRMKVVGPAQERLELSYRDLHGAEIRKKIDLGAGERDQVFNLVIGLSGLRWRSMKLDPAHSEKAVTQ
ncbi:MAG: hypothetical protein Q9160_002684 [Pyrenula sp. 1 TL-2023]